MRHPIYYESLLAVIRRAFFAYRGPYCLDLVGRLYQPPVGLVGRIRCPLYFKLPYKKCQHKYFVHVTMHVQFSKGGGHAHEFASVIGSLFCTS